jgi:hypothetical protein
MTKSYRPTNTLCSRRRSPSDDRSAQLRVSSDSERREELSRLLPLWPIEISDLSLEGRRRIIATLERALRAERRRGIAGHWAYDLARHAALAQTWKRERAAIQAIEKRQSSAGQRHGQQNSKARR